MSRDDGVFDALLVGLGQIGLGYDLTLEPDHFIYTHARAMSRHPRFRLIGGVDPAAGRRAVLEQTYGARGFADFDALPRDLAPDLVIVATATETHEQIVHDVLARLRPRAILCEKPLAYDLAAARRMVEACEARGVLLFVNYMRRADPAVTEITRRIEAGELLPPFKGVAWYSKGFLHNGSHLFDLLGHWLGPFEGGQMIDAGRPCGAADREPDLRVVFQRGTAVFLAAREEAFSHYTLELIAQNGRLRYDQGGAHVEWQPAVPHPRIPGYTVLREAAEQVLSGMDRYQWHVAEQLAAALDGRDHPLCTGQQALAALEHMHCVLEATGP